MPINIDIQIAIDEADIPDKSLLLYWAENAVQYEKKRASLTVRIVSESEICQLNHQFRQKNLPTNVLSFPFGSPPGVKTTLLGDVVICHNVVAEEALVQNKPLQAHYAHMVVHGVLHLLGFDHVDEIDAKKMESIEVKLLEQFGFPDPYKEDV